MFNVEGELYLKTRKRHLQLYVLFSYIFEIQRKNMSTYVKKYNTIYAQFMKDIKVKEVNVSRY